MIVIYIYLLRRISGIATILRFKYNEHHSVDLKK